MNKNFLFKYSTGRPKFIVNYNVKYEYYYNLLQYELDKKMYYYGGNFKNHNEISSSTLTKIVVQIKKLFYHISIWLIGSKFYSIKSAAKIWSTAYFNLDSHFNDGKFIYGSPPWAPSIKSKALFSFELFRATSRLKSKIERNDANSILTKAFFNEIDVYRLILKKFVIENKISAVFLPHNFGFFEKIIVDIFKELGQPTFLFNHGLPYYWKTCDNLSDYFVVWGDAIKKNYIRAGYPDSQILVSGHPSYKCLRNVDLRFSYSDILIITKSMNGVPSYDEYTLRDRSNSITYLNMVQYALESIGVKNVRFRPHPSENPGWYLKFIDLNFYSLDKEVLNVSLKKSTLVIGPTSTLFLESLIFGVNYIVFEPLLSNGYTFDNLKPIPPFDNTDDKVHCASSVEGLLEILVGRKIVDTEILSDYCSTKFNAELIINTIERTF